MSSLRKKHRLSAAIGALVALAFSAGDASAGVVYRWDVSFSAVGSYAADAFSIEWDGFPGFGDTTTLNPSGTAGGFSVTSLQYNEISCSGSCTHGYETNFSFSVPLGSVAGLVLRVPGQPISAVGTYDVFVSRWIRTGVGAFLDGSTTSSGRLQVSEANVVPEPGSVALAGLGLLAALAVTRHRPRTFA